MNNYFGLIAAIVFISGGFVFIHVKKKETLFSNRGYWLGIVQLIMGVVYLLAFLTKSGFI